MRHVAVVGAGAWGTALATLAARAGAKVSLWARDGAHVAEMTATGVNARRLPGISLAAAITPTADLAALTQVDIILLAVPTQALRGMLQAMAPFVPARIPVILCAKGIERGSGAFPSQILTQILPRNPPAILSGPSFAADVARGLPTAVALAAADASHAAELAQAFAAPWFRLYHSNDVIGVEIGGAAKNVLAIASGIASGKGLGASAGAALIARGFAELMRFGHAYGADPATLMGLSGLGDLVLTCSSEQSRNFSFGLALGRGASLAPASADHRLVEGAHSCAILVELARKKAVDMPICAAVEAVLGERLTIDAAIEALLNRPARPELATGNLAAR